MPAKNTNVEKFTELNEVLNQLAKLVRSSAYLSLIPLGLGGAQEKFISHLDKVNNSLANIADHDLDAEEVAKRKFGVIEKSGIFKDGYAVLLQMTRIQYFTSLTPPDSMHRKKHITYDNLSESHPRDLGIYRGKVLNSLAGLGVKLDMKDISEKPGTIESAFNLITKGIKNFKNERFTLRRNITLDI